MPDITTQKEEIVLTAAYEDGHEEPIVLQNPKENITAAEIASVAASARNALAGFVSFTSVKKRATTHTDLDLS